MSSKIPPAALNQQSPKGMWPTVAPYVIPPVAASAAIVLVFHDMVAKSAQQKGQAIPTMPLMEILKGGVKAAPTVGAIVGTQMVLQSLLEKTLTGQSNAGSLSSTFASSAVVGTASAPVLAVFNGQTMGWSVRESLRRFSAKQGLAIAVQETAFVGGLSAADRLAVPMRKWFGNNKAIDYIAAFVAGAAGSLAGHPANTALTRWQSGMTVDSACQLMWGSLRKARAVGGFSIVYKFGKEALNSTVPISK
jgi:hypothetical protein